MRSFLRILGLGLFTLLVVTAVTALAATNTVPSTRVINELISFNLNHLKPAACASITVSTVVTGSGTINGTAGNDLILGSSNLDTIGDLAGDDCILGGDGDDVITGGLGSDVCLGGPGNDIFLSCETQIQ